jgi:hypothetical protein
MAGNIAVINRGACTFAEKARNAQAAGAVAVVISNNRIEALSKMSGDFSAVTIPAMMVTQAGGAKLRESTGRAGAIVIGMHSVAMPRRLRCPVANRVYAGVEPMCVGFELTVLDKYGLDSSRLDDRESLTRLMKNEGLTVVKPALSSVAGIVSNGAAYSNFANCTWTIRVPGARNVTLTFSEFDMETDYDFVYVYDGLSVNSTLLARLTGQQLSGSSLPKPVTSSSGSMLIVLLADAASIAAGFEATYRTDNAPADAQPIAEPGSSVCTPAASPLRVVSAACRLCVLATVASVGGERFIEDDLHIVLESSLKKIPVSPCVPALAQRLRSEQMVRLGRALAGTGPVALVSSSVADLFTPETGDGFFGQQVFVGLDTSYRIYACDPADHPHLWAVSGSTDREHWKRCEGLLWLDLRNSQARSRLASGDGAAVPLVVYDNLGQCATILRTPPPSSAGTLRFGPGTAPETVACWLMRFFGPQAMACGLLTAPRVVSLSVEVPPVRLLADLVVRTGQHVQFIGGETTFIVGKQQLRVQTGATVGLQQITIAESMTASAIVIAGSASLRNCTVRNCVAQANSLSGYGLESRGGGIYVKSGGAAAVLNSWLVENAARNGTQSSEGGAMFAGFNSSVTLVSSVLSLNVASASRFGDASGGALMADRASVQVEATQWLGNAAMRGGAIYANGPGAVLNIVRSKMTNNSAVSEAGSAAGGALYLWNGVSSEILSSELTQNVARSLGANKGSSGGALYIGWSHRVNVAGCTIERNAAEAPNDGGASGGGLQADCGGMMDCQLNVTNTTVVRNRAQAAGAYAGGLSIDQHPSVQIVRSRINQNTAEGGGLAASSGQASGGGLCLSTKSVATIVDTELAGNVANGNQFSASGGAMSLASGSQATLDRTVVRDNAAEAGGLVSEGGAFFLRQSALAISDSNLLRNAALHGTKESRGGLISLLAPSNLRIMACAVLENSATSAAPGARCSAGAIYADDGASHLSIVASRVANNLAFCPDVSSAGGAVYAGKQSRLQLSDSEVDGNRVEGGSAEGGAIWCSGESLTMSNVSLVANAARANGTDAAAIGGAIFQQATRAELVDCRLVDNRARIEGRAIRASGGALHVAQGARASLLRCSLRHNAAGGRGAYQSYLSFAAALAEQRASSAMHIYSEGQLTLDGCTMSDEIGQRAMDSFRYTMWWWIVVEKGSVELRGSTFDASARFDPCRYVNDGYCDVPTDCPSGDYTDCGTTPSGAAPGYFFDPCLTANDGKCDSADPYCATSDYVDCGTAPPPDAGPFGKLLNVRSEQAEVVVRSSTVTNLTIQVSGSLGVVNATFVPQLNSSDPMTRTVQPHPDCGTTLLGRPLCDPRALCQPRASGGVECSCVGDGLDFRPGVPADGQQCLQQTSIKLLTQTSHVTMSVKKPSFRAGAVAIVFAAAGETGFNASYHVSMTRVQPDDGAPRLLGSNSTEHGQSSSGRQRMSIAGHHLIWEGPPPAAESVVDLNVDAGRFSFSRTFALSIELNCTVGEPCVEDGDTVNTIVTAVAASHGLVSEVMISTTVESLVSCDHSAGWIEGLRPDEDSVSTLFPIKLHFVARDCDGMPIKFTRADFNVSFGDQSVPHARKDRGSSEYVAELDTELTSSAGSFELVVIALEGLSQASTRNASGCILFHRTIHVQANIQQYIVAGVLAGIALAVLALLGVLLIRCNAPFCRTLLVGDAHLNA